MIGVDTNVLVRIFVNDESDRSQIEKARQIVKNHDRVYISHFQAVLTIPLHRDHQGKYPLFR